MNSFCYLELAACCSPIASAKLRPLQLLFPDGVRFSCSTASRSRPLQLLLPDYVGFSLLLPDRVHFSYCMLPA